MPSFRRSFVFAVLIGLSFCLPATKAAAQENCEMYQTTGEVVDVFKTPSTKSGYFELLEKGDVTCITRQQTSGNRNWGFVKYRKDKNGQKIVVNGWVDLQFVAPEGGIGAARAVEQQGQPPQSAAATTSNGIPADEVAYWNTVRDSGDPDLLRLYLDKYPNGTFGDLALAMIAKLQSGTVVSPTTKQTKAYVPSPKKTTTTKRSKPRKKTVRRTTGSKTKKTTRKRPTTTKKKVQRKITRRRAKKCRYESQYECLSRGGYTSKGRCDVRYICR